MTSFAPFRTDFAPRDEEIAARLLLTATLSPDAEKRVDQSARGMIHAIRTKTSGLGGERIAPRIFALNARRSRFNGAGRSAAACAGCRNRRQSD